MIKELSKSIINRLSYKNRYLKWPSRENFQAYKKKKIFCNTLNKKTKKAIENGIMGSKKFWSTVKLFFSSKGFITITSTEIDNKIIGDESELA